MEVTGSFGTIPVVEEQGNSRNTSTSADELQLDFLELLVAQLQYQDPLEPTKNTEFTSQMAQFSSLDAQQKSNSLLQELINSQGGNQMNQAVAYIGKQVVVSGNKTVMKEGAATVRFQTPSAGMVDISLYNPYGELVKNVGPTFFPEGEGRAVIDGVDRKGSALPDGNYTFSVRLREENGDHLALSTLEAGEVTGVLKDDAGVTLDLSGRLVALDSVRRIEQGNG